MDEGWSAFFEEIESIKKRLAALEKEMRPEEIGEKIIEKLRSSGVTV